MRKIPPTLASFLYTFSRPFFLQFTTLIITSLVYATHYSVNPYITKLIIDSIANCSVDVISTETYFYCILYVFFSFIFFAIARFEDIVENTAFPYFRANIIRKTFHNLQYQSYNYFQENLPGNLASKVTDLARSSVAIIRESLAFFLPRFFGLIVGIITLSCVHISIGIIFIVWCITFFAGFYILSRPVNVHVKRFAASLNGIAGYIVDTIINITSVKLFAREEHEDTIIKQKLGHLVEHDLATRRSILQTRIFLSISTVICIGGTLIALLHARKKGYVTVGDFALVFSLTRFIIVELYQVSKELPKILEEIGVARNALQLLSHVPEITDEPHAPILHVTKGEIVFDHVNFRYSEEESVFSNKSIRIAPGQKVGLVGLSGSGKSTFVNLILRFFDVESGHIFIDGQNIAQVTQKSLHEQIGMIPQDPILFHRSIIDNIQYGNLCATYDNVIESSKKAFCHEFVERLTDGYATVVGERGIKLSGGQRQRIAIARAFLKNAPILILDEATSALDSVTEQHIKESLSILMAHKTCIIIAHRLSTLMDVDRILVFQDGQIIEDGSHTELLALNGHYAKLWSIQAGGFIP